MSDKEELGLDPESVKILQNVRAQLESGEDLGPLTKEAMESIDFASQIVNSIMAGKQIDLAYLKLYTEGITNKMNSLNPPAPAKRLGKRKRLKRNE
jgi:hypothetical protein